MKYISGDHMKLTAEHKKVQKKDTSAGDCIFN